MLRSVIHRTIARRIILSILTIFPLLCGCLSERSYPLRQQDLVLLPLQHEHRGDARSWLAWAHFELKGELPVFSRPALLTDDLQTEAGPVDVQKHFGRRFEDQDTLLCNLGGMLNTAHLAATGFHIEHPPPPWPGFEDVWIPIHTAGEPLELSGRLGMATDPHGGVVRQADCIVLLPGLFGDNGVLRSRDLALALHRRGLHVLSIELRGCGQTDRRYSRACSTWGVLESMDLLEVARWLQAKPQVRRTGLIGFCWGANIALLTAWADGRSGRHPSMTSELAAYFEQPAGARHYEAGVMAFSPVLRFEELIASLDSPQSQIQAPVLSAVQDTVRFRNAQKAHGLEPPYSLRELIDFEMSSYDFPFQDPVKHGLRYLRILPYDGKPAGDKLEDVRAPVLLVQAATDPLNPCQDLADLLAGTDNRNVAAAVLPGGGHVGFAEYARSYYFSLICNFFDPQRGPLAVPPPSTAPAPHSPPAP